MEWIDIYEDKRRFELREGKQGFAILELVSGVYVCRDSLTKNDFFFDMWSYKYNSTEMDTSELFKRAEAKLLENWISKAESLSKAIAGLKMGREVIVTDYAIGQAVHIVEYSREKEGYVIFQARFKGVCQEDYRLLNMFETIGGEQDVFMEPKDSDKIFVRHDAAVRECVSLNESLRKGK